MADVTGVAALALFGGIGLGLLLGLLHRLIERFGRLHLLSALLDRIRKIAHAIFGRLSPFARGPLPPAAVLSERVLLPSDISAAA